MVPSMLRCQLMRILTSVNEYAVLVLLIQVPPTPWRWKLGVQ